MAELEASNLSMSPPVSRSKWIRRVSFDLTGLPPTWKEVEAYVFDPSPEADEKVIDRLLIEPNHADGKMSGLYNGRFKKYVGRRDYRIIYYWCLLCRKENRRLDKECDDCQTIPDNSVIFFDLYHKKDTKKFKKV